jgi:hypothetical protein
MRFQHVFNRDEGVFAKLHEYATGPRLGDNTPILGRPSVFLGGHMHRQRMVVEFSFHIISTDIQ